MKKYTIGILFTPDFKEVLLLQKVKPEWQRGLMNFPGGHLEEGETIHECISREFFEETGITTKSIEWRYIGRITNHDNYSYFILTAVYDNETHGTAWNKTIEAVGWQKCDDLPINVISNLHWLVPFAINYWKQGNADNLSFGVFEYTD